ncbi:hypothetical protein P7C70_g7567, partial [Phenoliferia sp. Uapishka_3]
MASIHDLPSETILRILSFIHTPSSLKTPTDLARFKKDETLFDNYNESVRSLQRASCVSKLWLTLAQPMLWCHLNVWTYIGARLINECPALGRFTTDELNVLVGEDDEWTVKGWRNNFLSLVTRLKGLKKLGLAGIRPINAEWVQEENLKDLTHLNVNVFMFQITLAPPAIFQLSSLEIGSYVHDASFIESIFKSSSKTLTSLKFKPAYPKTPTTLLNAFSLIQNSLQHFELVGKLQDVEAVLPNLKSLTSVRFTFRMYQEDFFGFLSTALGALPACTTSVTLSLRQPFEHLGINIKGVVERLRDGWD